MRVFRLLLAAVFVAFSLVPSVADGQCFSANVSKSDITCYGLDNGSLTIGFADNGGGLPSSVTISGPNGYTMAELFQDTVLSELQPGIYNVEATDGICNYNQAYTIAEPTNIVTNTPANQAGCHGTLVTLSTSGTGGGVDPLVLNWYDDNGSAVADGQISNATAANDGVYTLVITDNTGCTDTTTTTLTVYQVAVVNADDSTYCHNETIYLTSTVSGGTAPYTYTWSGPGFTGSNGDEMIASATTSNTGAYGLFVTDANGCTGTDTNSVTVATEVLATVSNDTTVCHGVSFTLAGSATGGSGIYTYSWSGPGGYNSTDQNPEILNGSAVNSGNYVFHATDENGCANTTASVVLTWNSELQVTAQPDSTYCDGATIILSAQAADGTAPYGYTWFNGSDDTLAGGQITNATTADSGRYYVVANDNLNCTATDTVVISVSTPLVAVAPSDTSYCNGAAISLSGSVSGGSETYITYSWSGPNSFSGNTATVNVTNNADTVHSGGYSLEVTDSRGCVSNSATVNITVNQAIVTTAPADSTYCNGATISLAANAEGGSGNFSFAWSGPGGFSSNDQSAERLNGEVSHTGTYTVTVIDDNGCTGPAATTEVTVSSPVLAIAANDTTYCHGATVTLSGDASGGVGNYTYSWTNSNEDPVAGGVIASATAAETGDYYLTVTDGNECIGVDTMHITILDPVTAAMTPDSNYCFGDTAMLLSTPAGGSGTYISYAWYGPASFTSNSQNAQVNTLNASKGGIYNLIVTDNLGCKSDSIPVSVNVYDPILVTASNDGKCDGVDVALSFVSSGGNGDMTYLWTGPGGYSSTDDFPVLLAATAANNGLYTLVLTDEIGCKSQPAGTTVTVTSPVIATNVGNNATCPGVTVTFSATGSGGTAPYTYTWKNADDDEIINGVLLNPTTNEEGDYTVVVTDTNGCFSAAYTTTLDLFDAPTAEASSFTSVLVGSDSLVVSFDRGDGDGVIVVMHEGSAPNTDPSCGAVYNYQYNTVINYNSGSFSGLGNGKVVYNSRMTTPTVELTLTGLTFNTTYYFSVYEYDSSANGTAYLVDPKLEADETTAHIPTGFASNIRFENMDNTSLTAEWTNGNGQGRLVLLQTNDTVFAGNPPVDGTTYTANSVPGLGDSTGAGVYVVYNGTDSAVNLSGLNPFGLYTLVVYEYNGTGASIKYSQGTERGFRTSATVAGNISKYTIQLKFTNPVADKGVLVVMRQGAPVTDVPVDGTDYAASTNKNVTFDTSVVPSLGDSYVVFKNRNRDGARNPDYYTLNMLGLQSDRAYYFEIYEWDTLTNNYVYHPELDFDTSTLLGSPSVPSNNMRVDSVTATSVRIRWSNGNGDRRMVIVKERRNNTAVNGVTVDSVSYMANSVYGMGDTLSRPDAANYTGTNYIVYNGTDSSVVVTGLNPLTLYSFGVVEYNGDNGEENYRGSYPNISVTTAGIRLTNVQSKKMTITFAHSNNRGAIVLVKEGSPITMNPVNGVSYTGPVFTSVPSTPPTVSFNADTLGVIDGAKVVYKNPVAIPATKSVIISDLKSAIDYYVAAYEWDSAGNVYTTFSVLMADTTTVLAAPTSVAKNIAFEDITSGSFKVKWTNGNGNNRIVVVKGGSKVNASPEDSVTYSANAVFGMGDTLALPGGATNTDENYVVYKGNDSSVVVTNLQGSTQYFVRIFEYNGTATPDYGAGSANVSVKTAADFVNIKKTGQVYAQTFDSMAITNSLPAAWQSSDATIVSSTGSTSTPGVYHFGGGNYPAADRSLGSIGDNSFGVKLRNGSTTAITSILVRYKGIQWRKGGVSTIASPDALHVQYSLDAYSVSDPNQYLSNAPATWTDASTATWMNNTNIHFYSLETGPGAASLNVPNSLPSEIRSASITGLNLQPGQTIMIRFKDLDLGGNDDALAIDSVEIVPFLNTIVGGGTIDNGTLADLNIVGDEVVQNKSSVTVNNSLNIENGSVLNMIASASRTLKVNGKIYSDNDTGNGAFATGVLSSINVAGSEGMNHLNFVPGSNSMRHLTLSSGASASLNSAVAINGGAQFGLVTVGSPSATSVLNTNGLLTLKSDSFGTASIAAIYGSVNGEVTIERAFTAKAGNRIMGHPFDVNLPLSQFNDDITLDVSGTSSQNIWNFNMGTTSAVQAADLLTNGAWDAYSSNADNWNRRSVVRLSKSVGAVTADFSGPINQGTQSVIITGDMGDIAIVGNPYPAAVKMGNILVNAIGIADTVWTYNLVTNSFKAVPAASWSSINVPVFGFVVVKLASGSAMINFGETDKMASTSTATLYRDGGAEEENQNTVVLGGTSSTSLAMSLVPNPATDVVTVSISGAQSGSASIKVYSVTGQLMIAEALEIQQHAQITLQLQDLPKGSYIVEVTTDNERLTSQMIKM
ncbi:MAG: T9SS type A sorting domain-containing protein [Sphingobacteriales bacterium]|nr:MAG: T9SS type A sorting domain-containing protein [Sphingobacteriales bacterium]